jgi:outer membrane protein OmpA-like peptidoglycan-associated protein
MEPIAVGANINLNNIYFATASAELQKKSFSELFLLVQLLKENPNMKIEIGGHTDNTGTSEDNLNLSQQRAESVVAFLKSKGITEERMKAKGYGETVPIASNETEEDRSKNRRTSVRILQ